MNHSSRIAPESSSQCPILSLNPESDDLCQRDKVPVGANIISVGNFREMVEGAEGKTTICTSSIIHINN